MASAIVNGLLTNKHYIPEEIACSGGNSTSGALLAEKTGIHYHKDIAPAVNESEAVVLACKPQQFAMIDPAVIEASKEKLVLSILAGTKLAKLSKTFDTARNIVRTMPNTPGQIGAGVTAFATLHALTKGDQEIVGNLLSALGVFHEVDEVHLDAVTALSGSGPAYVFEFAAALRDAGIHCGLETNLSSELAIDTLLGAAMLLAESAENPEALRNAVTSPGGTTAAALEVMRQRKFRKNPQALDLRQVRHFVKININCKGTRYIVIGSTQSHSRRSGILTITRTTHDFNFCNDHKTCTIFL